MSFGVLFKELGAAMITLSMDLVKAITRRHYVKNKKLIYLADLPIEILAHIFSFLTGKELAKISRVCKRFYDVTQIDYLWMHCCCTEFGISPSIPQHLTYKEIYTKALFKYGRLIGLWQPQVSCYGGLLEIQFKDGKFVGHEIQPPMFHQVLKPIRRRPLFEIRLSQAASPNNTEVACFCGSTKPNHAEIQFLRGDKFIFKCLNEERFHVEEVVIPWLNYGIPQQLVGYPELQRNKSFIILQYRFSFQYWPVKFPKSQQGVPIQPGIFKGTYGAHGVELVHLSYDSHNVQALKISGDPNVPANKVTFQADLKCPMSLGMEEQRSLATLEALLPVGGDLPDGPQPFLLPPEIQGMDLPPTASARFFGQGQIAGDNFSNPSFTRGHWVIFSEDLFGFLWLELNSLSVYHRVVLEGAY